MNTQEAIDRFVAGCQADDRIAAVLLFGSHARDEADAFSDLDLGVITTDGALDPVLRDREALVRFLGEPLFLDDFGNPANVHAILADGLVLELIFAPVSELSIEGTYRVLLDKAGVAMADTDEPAREQPSASELEQLIHAFWHEVEHVASALARGQVLWAHGGLEALRGTCIRLARVRAGAERQDEEPYWKVDPELDGPMRAVLLATIVPPDPAQMRDAALGLVRIFEALAQPIAASRGFAYPTELDRLVTERLNQVPSAST